MLLHVLIAGMVATIAMTLVMWLIHASGFAEADMVRAIGTLVTRGRGGALVPGLLVHLGAGAVFALPYTLVLRATAFQGAGALAAAGGAMGFLHGAAMAFVLHALVAQHHPIDRFRNVGFEVGAAHVVGHVVYGIAIGLACARLGPGVPAI